MIRTSTEADSREKARGFTLIELLVVTAILGVVVAAVGACLAGGLRVWDVARQFNRHEADALIGFQVMRRDMGRILPLELTPFEGADDGFLFTGVSAVPDAEGRDEAVTRLAHVRYFLDRDRRAWCRAAGPLAWSDAPAPEALEVLVADVDAVALRYAAAPEDGERAGDAGWVDRWENPTNMPGVVEVELTMGDTKMAQWFVVPLAGGAQ